MRVRSASMLIFHLPLLLAYLNRNSSGMAACLSKTALTKQRSNQRWIRPDAEPMGQHQPGGSEPTVLTLQRVALVQDRLLARQRCTVSHLS